MFCFKSTGSHIPIHGMGVYKVLVSFPDFKSGVAYHKWAGWVRFPHAPATITKASFMWDSIDYQYSS